MSINTKVNICGVELKNPVIAASGTFGFGREFGELYDLNILGGISLKGMTVHRREGNATPRIAETASGIINSVGLQNPGVEHFLKHDLPYLNNFNTAIIANIAGSTISDYVEMGQRVSVAGIDMIELNISCPNVKEGGMAFGASPKSVKEVTEHVKKAAKKPLIVKLSPNVASIRDCAIAAEEGGADGISLINTITAMAVDVNTRKPILGNIIGGLSGPAIKNIALKMTYDVFKAVKIPIIGMGGIMNATDVVEFLLCGASAVQVGTANLIDPFALPKIIDGLKDYMNKNGVKDITDLIGGIIC